MIQTDSCQAAKEAGKQACLIYKIVISMTDLVHGDKRALNSNWGFYFKLAYGDYGKVTLTQLPHTLLAGFCWMKK